MFSRRSAFERRPNALALAVAAARERGEPLIDLSESNPTRAGIPYDDGAIRAAMTRGLEAAYEPDPMGLEAARRAVADWWSRKGRSVSPERVLLAASTSEIYSLLFKLLTDPGDEVLVPEPGYPMLEHLARLDAVRLVPYPLRYDGEWRVDVESLGERKTPRTRAVVSVSPNNPTGSFLKRAELAALASLELPIISDEVFADYVVDDAPGRVQTALEHERARTFVLGGLSKLAGLPQLKLGWCTLGGPAEGVDEAIARLELMADAFLSASTPVQAALPELMPLGRAHNAIAGRVVEHAARLREALAASPVTVLKVEGGWYAVVRLPAVRSEESWVVGLVEEAGVLVQPGWFYDFRAEPFAVVSLLTPPEPFGEGVERLARHVAAHA